MRNLVGLDSHDANTACAEELIRAGIPMAHNVNPGEVKSGVGGALCGWTFYRAWRYWSASGPALPLSVARVLWRDHGGYVRAGGDCDCREPTGSGYPRTTNYHIDTPEGLVAFAAVLRNLP